MIHEKMAEFERFVFLDPSVTQIIELTLKEKLINE
jgi:hypothetical protein